MSLFADHAIILVAALLIDALLGDPVWLWSRIPHPVVLLGQLIATLDRALNHNRDPDTHRQAAGVLAVAIVVAVAAAIGVALEILFRALPFGWIGKLLVVAVMLAGGSLFDHVRGVQRALASGSITGARRAVGRIVGRDTSGLDEAGVSRAAIESCAESFSDGVIAPALWFVLLGLPGLLVCRAINTADSMIGHRTPRHAAFGWAAAKADDVLNWPAARLSAALIALAARAGHGSARAAFAAIRRDARRHESPNAGWPEAAMAGALGLALLGPRVYGGEVVTAPFLNPEGRKEAVAGDIGRALMVCGTAGALFALVLVIVAHLLAL
ncbi:MAG: cobalamin biosynthesis protein [Bauldia sp.]|nr:cobalamin biosynthesis protein [Bauldia sp.]